MTLHYRAEGRQSYAVLLFAPSSRPFDLFDPERKGRVKLYVRRVYISDDAELLPSYLRFVRGVIDSEDLPLNISREMLQNNPQVAQIRKAVTGRVIGELESLAGNDAAAFAKVWEAFGSVLKEGIYEDHERRDQLLALARFTTTKDGGPRSLKRVCGRSQAQPDRHLLSRRRQRRAPQGRARSWRPPGPAASRCCCSTDPVDAFWTSLPLGFEGKPLKSLSQGDVDFGLVPLLDDSPADPATPSRAVDDAVIVAAVKAALGERVSDVRASQRLTDSAACLVARRLGPRPGARAAAGAPEPTPAPNRSSRSTRAIRWSRPSPTPSSARAMPTWQIWRSCCSTRPTSSTAKFPTTPPPSPAA